MISVAEDFVLLVRAQGALVRVLLSDATASTDWSLARSAVNHIGVHVDDEDDQAPAGDLGIVADMGMSAQDMGALLDDYDLYPEEILSEVADSVGVRHQVRRARSASPGDPLLPVRRDPLGGPDAGGPRPGRAGRRLGRRTHRRRGALRRPVR